MKTPYFTQDTIAERTEQFLEGVKSYRNRHPIRLEPERASLIILDMQEYFLNETSHAFTPAARAIVPGLKQLAKAFRKTGKPVILTRHLNTPRDALQMAEWWNDLIREEKPLSGLIPELKEAGGTVLKKAQYDAFHGTSLEKWLRDREVTQVVIGGVLTHLCCETTARSAFIRGFEVFFLVDGTADCNEEFHRASVLNLSHGFAHPVTVEEVLEGVEGRE